VPIGKTSVYGLKKWETEIDEFKGGTIRAIAEEFLKGQAEPKHIDEITDYVNRYRNTKPRSVYANLNTDTWKRFVYFCGHLIGLSAKKYSIEKYGLAIRQNIKRKTWEERFSDLQKFAEENDRLPKSTTNVCERKLYTFMIVQLKKAKKGQIDDQKLSRINDLILKYKSQKGKRALS